MAETDDEQESKAATFTKAEVEVLLKACKKYRSSIPSYLKSADAELRIIGAIIRKLS